MRIRTLREHDFTTEPIITAYTTVTFVVVSTEVYRRVNARLVDCLLVLVQSTLTGRQSSAHNAVTMTVVSVVVRLHLN